MELLSIVKKFYEFLEKQIELIRATYAQYKSNKNRRLASDYAKKFPFVKTKFSLPDLDEIRSWESTKETFHPENELNPLLEHFITKITGLYKHGQTEKTSLCNLRILSNIRLGKLTIAISKNTLDAKNQWEARLIKALKEMFPHAELKNYIIIVSSIKNDLNGNATHCKNIDEAISDYTRGNFKIIFVCSNDARFHDILTFLKSYNGFSAERQLLIDIQQDEAHNREEGIPSKRTLVENIVINPYVESYVPVSASYDPIIDDAKCLWKKTNLDMYAIDYTKNSQTLSTSDNYSSISDALPLSFEQLTSHSSYKDHQITEFDAATFDEADEPGYYSIARNSKWADPKEVANDKQRRRQLEFCKFMKYEKDAVNLGMNILDNYLSYKYTEGDTTIETPIILASVKNIHIITTPSRVAVTIHLMKYAINQPYNPICFGLYRGEINILYKNRLAQTIRQQFSKVGDTCDSEELNNKIFGCLSTIKKSGESIERPIIIFGNYKPTGESITFVNYKYGTIRSDTLLPIAGQTREMNYQGFLRSCYMDTKFKENAPEFVHPAKWIIGSQRSIDDALSYEKENDERIFRLKNSSFSSELVSPVIPAAYAEDDVTNISVPLKIMIHDMEDALVNQARQILGKSKRSEGDKKQLLALLHEMSTVGTATISDPTGKFNFGTYTLKDIRCYKQHSKKDIDERKETQGTNYKPFEADWRFREYDSNHTLKTSYINNKREIEINNCELLAAFDKYEYDKFVNHRSCIWISYRFE